MSDNKQQCFRLVFMSPWSFEQLFGVTVFMYIFIKGTFPLYHGLHMNLRYGKGVVLFNHCFIL